MVKNLPINAKDRRDMGSIAGLGRSPGGRPGKHPITWKFLVPGEPHGQRNLAGCSPWSHAESDMACQAHTAVLHGVITETGLRRLTCFYFVVSLLPQYFCQLINIQPFFYVCLCVNTFYLMNISLTKSFTSIKKLQRYFIFRKE